MKNVNYIFIHPEVGVWGEEANGRIRDEERSLGYFLGLMLKGAKIKSDKFNGIFFKGVNKPEENIYYINNLLIIDIEFPEEIYPPKGKINEINEYLIKRVEDGLVKIHKEYSEIVSILKSGIDEFRGANYECVWIHKKRKIGKAMVQLRCEMNTEYFKLYLDMLNKDERYNQSKLLLETAPNEYSFKHRFKSLEILDNEIIVTDYLDRKQFVVKIKLLDQSLSDTVFFDGDVEYFGQW